MKKKHKQSILQKPFNKTIEQKRTKNKTQMAHQVFFQLGNFSRQSQRPSKALYFCSMFLSINKLFITYYFILLEIYTFKLFRSTKSSVYISTFTVVFSWRFRRKFTTLTVASFFSSVQRGRSTLAVHSDFFCSDF